MSAPLAFLLPLTLTANRFIAFVLFWLQKIVFSQRNLSINYFSLHLILFDIVILAIRKKLFADFIKGFCYCLSPEHSLVDIIKHAVVLRQGVTSEKMPNKSNKRWVLLQRNENWPSLERLFHFGSFWLFWSLAPSANVGQPHTWAHNSSLWSLLRPCKNSSRVIPVTQLVILL